MDNSSFQEWFQSESSCEDWSEWKAGQIFHKIEKNLSGELADPSRVGALRLQPIPTDESKELQWWVYPIDGSKPNGFILGLRQPIKAFDVNGTVFFEGSWGNVSFEHLKEKYPCFIWVAPIHRQGGKRWEVKKTWWSRILARFKP